MPRVAKTSTSIRAQLTPAVDQEHHAQLDDEHHDADAHDDPEQQRRLDARDVAGSTPSTPTVASFTMPSHSVASCTSHAEPPMTRSTMSTAPIVIVDGRFAVGAAVTGRARSSELSNAARFSPACAGELQALRRHAGCGCRRTGIRHLRIGRAGR